MRTEAKMLIRGVSSVELGDTRASQFLPQMKLLVWGNEANFSARLSDAKFDLGEISHIAEKTTWRRGLVEAAFYPTGEGYEFELILASRPISPTIEFSLQHKNMAFFFQPALTKEEERAGDYRPDDVVGSYAVYHASRKGNEYGIGKAFHLYRPWAQDATGKRVWCDLAIDPKLNRMTIALPVEFWRSAVYPVLVDPTFGYTSAPATESAWTSNRLYGATGTPASSGTVTSIWVYARVTTGSGNVKPVLVLKSAKTIVSNGVGNPGAVNTTSGAWRECTYTTGPSVTGGTAYYVCAVGDSGMDFGRFYFDNTGSSGDAAIDTSNSYTTPTDPTDMTTQARQYGFYADYTEPPSMLPPFPRIVQPILAM